MSEAIPVLVAILAAILGGLGGVSAILRVQNDNASSAATAAKTISDGAKTVVDLMDARLDENEKRALSNEARLDLLEEHVTNFDAWADRLLSLLERAVELLPEAIRTQYQHETVSLKVTRPNRNKRASAASSPTVPVVPE